MQEAVAWAAQQTAEAMRTRILEGSAGIKEAAEAAANETAARARALLADGAWSGQLPQRRPF